MYCVRLIGSSSRGCVNEGEAGITLERVGFKAPPRVELGLLGSWRAQSAAITLWNLFGHGQFQILLRVASEPIRSIRPITIQIVRLPRYTRLTPTLTFLHLPFKAARGFFSKTEERLFSMLT